MDQNFSAGDMANILAVTKPTIAKWIDDGKLSCTKKNADTGQSIFTLEDINKNVEHNNRKRTPVITFGNVKGGVGKTFIVINLASALSKFGFKTLVVDSDKQGNLSDFFLDQIPGKMDSTILDIFVNDNPPGSTIWNTKYDMIDIIPCNLNFSEIVRKQSFETYLRLKSFIDKVKDKYHFVLIDTQPDITLPVEASIVAADYVIGVTDPDTWGLNGIQNLRDKANEINTSFNKNLKMLGFIYNKVFETRRLDKEIIEITKGSLNGIRAFRSRIPLIQGFRESIASKASILDLEYADAKIKTKIYDLTIEVLNVLS